MKKITYEYAQRARQTYQELRALGRSHASAIQSVASGSDLSERHMRNIIAGRVWKQRVCERVGVASTEPANSRIVNQSKEDGK